MVEPVSVVERELKKLADQLECSICLQSFTEPKMLQCFHMFCKDCLQPLVLQDQHGLSLRCPKCHRFTLLPANGVSGLQPAFHIHHLFEVQDALQKVQHGQEGKIIQCEKCKMKEACSYCRDCSKFVCEACIKMHQTWEEYSTHKVISLDQLMSDTMEMVPSTKKPLYCFKHPGKELDLFCETDQELICRDCVIVTHQNHEYNLVSKVFSEYQHTITTHLEPVKQQLSAVNEAIQDLDTARDQIVDQRVAVETDIKKKIGQIHEALEVRKTMLIGQLDQITQQKLKTLSTQRDKLELIQTRLKSCLEFVSSSQEMGCKGEVLAIKKSVVQQMKVLSTDFGQREFLPQEQADMALTTCSNLLPACQQFGLVYCHPVCPEKCYATGKGLEVATVGERSTVIMHTVDTQGSKCAKPLPLSSISCELVSYSNTERMKWNAMTAEPSGYEIIYQPSDSERIKCNVKPSKINEYKIDYKLARKTRHQLHLKVSDRHIRGSPFTLVAGGELEVPVRMVAGLKGPWGVAVGRQIIIAEFHGHCLSVFSPSGKKTKLLGEKGSSPGQFLFPLGVAVDKADNILVVDGGNHRIQKFTADGDVLVLVGSEGNKPLQFNCPVGIGISPNDKVYICDRGNNRVQILNPDLTFLSSFGSKGSGNGRFQHPWDVAFDSQSNVYVADSENHRIQVFTEDGLFLRKFGKKGGGDGELNFPASVIVNSDDVIYVADSNNHRVSLFTSKGHFHRAFGTWGEGPGQFNLPRGLAIDKDGLVYISDGNNDRVHIW